MTIPRPIPGLVSSTVLVESFEAGQSVAVFMREPAAINTQIVALGVDAYLKMLLTDNFVHTDLHPGEPQAGLRSRQAGRHRQTGRQAGSGACHAVQLAEALCCPAVGSSVRVLLSWVV